MGHTSRLGGLMIITGCSTLTITEIIINKIGEEFRPEQAGEDCIIIQGEQAEEDCIIIQGYDLFK